MAYGHGIMGAGMGANEMAIDTMTEGVSREGIRNLVEVMQAELLVGVSDRLRETDGIITALTAGWQGVARDTFLQQMSSAINAVIADLNAEYTDLLMRLSEIVNNYFDQDQRMMDMIDG